MSTHVVPENDERRHIEDVYCWCEPIVLYRDEDTGEEYDDPPKVLHHAADCREVCEALTNECVAPNKRWFVIHV
jgi:hypothetical protein